MSFPSGVTEHPINKSGKRKILVSVWDFGATHPQSERSHYLCNDHPAKMRPSLARAILQIYGESPVLDPMAGIGTTLVEAMLLGMDAVGVEFEKKFVDQANENISHAKKSFFNENLGKAICVKGDARDLSCLNNPINSIVFSPPYSEGIGHPAGKKASDNYPWRLKLQRNMTEVWSEGSISKLRYGSVVFSPPYFDALSIKKGGGSKDCACCEESTNDLRMKRSGPFAAKKSLPTPYSSRAENIGNIPEYGSVIFSPPYEGALNASKHVGGISSRVPKLAKTVQYSKDRKNIGNMIGQTYLKEMLKVYRECFRLLKPEKLMVVVVKDIQRRWTTIPLGADTIRLCQLAGFEVHDIIVNKMYFPSFWMLDLAKKSQTEANKGTMRFHAMKTHEYVLVFRKPSPRQQRTFVHT